MKKKILGVAFGLMVIGGLTGCEKTEEKIQLIMADVQEGEHPTAVACDKFADLVKKKTQGRIEIEVYHGDILGSEQEQLEQVAVGGIDLVRASVGVISKYDEELQALQGLYLYDSDEQMWNVLNGEIGQNFLNSANLLEDNMIGLTWFSGGSRNFYSADRPITSLEDLAGLAIRVNTPAMIAFLESVDAQPKNIAYNDIFSSIESGAIDGAENNWPSYISSGHYQVAPYITVDEHTKVPEMIIASKSAMEALSQEDQAILKECAEEIKEYQIKAMQVNEEKAMKVAEEAGCTITYLTQEQLKAFQEAGNMINQELNAEYMDIINQIKQTK